ncbi:Maf-like protein [Namhaeicola litoreus]|uniref:dTTP/UTP pyrophosphatase n=1 Tax=Namhaeicola litoreus TaxID=1052145 RepID=A0ABW3Y565_9FLAO
MINFPYKIILASASPRRQDFLKALEIPFEIRLKEVEEVFPPTLKREEITNFLAILKAEPFLKELKKDEILITSDTIVWLDNAALGKPKNYHEAFSMLKSLSGRMHEVITSICLTSNRKQVIKHDMTKVYFKELKEEEIKFYLESFKPYDKAGSYGIQEWIGLIAVTKIEGSYFNVMGLPTEKLYTSLEEFTAEG